MSLLPQGAIVHCSPLFWHRSKCQSWPCLLEVGFNCLANIRYFIGHPAAQNWFYQEQLSVGRVFEPAQNVDAILWLHLVVVWDVVNDDCFSQIPAQQRQVFDVGALSEATAVAIESESDVPLLIQIIKDPVCIILEACCKNDQLVMLLHLL